ncbi:hypothetical protein [Zavarzinia sp. CC-PAN008]|uniref:hypothetical protein n=1 Tax=Zavarzinia sp. CC-PAN008 TaxID=3243332 RepID=UPI003F744FB2
MSFLMPKRPAMTPPPAPPTKADPAVMAAADAEMARQRTASGRAATILTPAAGTPTAAAPKTLLGS